MTISRRGLFRVGVAAATGMAVPISIDEVVDKRSRITPITDAAIYPPLPFDAATAHLLLTDLHSNGSDECYAGPIEP